MIYRNEQYSKVEGKSIEALEAELQAVYASYPEYHAPEYGGGDFAVMVKRFAEDDFYKLHYVARTYRELLNAK
jgi:hypothetical protein